MKKSNVAVIALGLFVMACNANASKEANTRNSDSVMVDSVHQSQSALDWNGVYEGVLPCADCEGIQTQIELKNDQTFVKNEEYLGKKDGKFKTNGKIEWNTNGNDIKLISTDGDTTLYKVKEGMISQLDMDEKEITGEMAKMYDLIKK